MGEHLRDTAVQICEEFGHASIIADRHGKIEELAEAGVTLTACRQRDIIVRDQTSNRVMRTRSADLMEHLPGPRTSKWPDGERFIEAFRHGTLTVEIYAPVGRDPQTPHDRDEVYFVIAGTGEFVVAGERSRAAPGDALFVAANVEHRFENFTADFATWVVFYGPQGGEPA
jgi:mannose-6-phosphate isomerase-like protein (cupin superfamily)